MDDTITMYRPVGPNELELLQQNGVRRWVPGLRKCWLILGMVLLMPVSSYSQDSASALQRELMEMGESDQLRGDIRNIEMEYGYGSPEYLEAWNKQNVIDHRNQERLAEIVEQWGWPKASVVGRDAATSAFLIVQHAELAVQQYYLPIIEQAVKDREASASSFALLQDRVLMREGKKTLYGTQLRRNEETGEWFLWPIERQEDVDTRRAAMGMGPLAEELARYPFEIVPVPADFELRPEP